VNHDEADEVLVIVATDRIADKGAAWEEIEN
jgi:hypothetical protein